MPRTVIIGREPGCDIVLEHPSISRRHACLLIDQSRYLLEDLNSTNGTFVNGRQVKSCAVTVRDVVQIGELILPWTQVLQHLQAPGKPSLLLECMGLEVRAPGNGRQLLRDVTFGATGGQLLAIIGPSRAEKTTLIRALVGQTVPSRGGLKCNGVSLLRAGSLAGSWIGYVPQDDLVHRELRVREALSYSAELRVPGDRGPDDIARRVLDAADFCHLSPRLDQRIGRLSGAERKLANVAVELLTQPPILIFDEPTSGLDPALERAFMELCRQLADQGHLVIVTADVTRSLEMCDRVLVIAGGTMVFYAPPRYLTTFFQVSEPGDLYEQLGEPSRWASAYKASRLFVRYLVPSMRHGRTPPLPPSGDLGGWARQLSVLTRRYLSVLAGDNRNLAFMGLQAPLIAVVIALVFPGDAFSSISAMKSAPALLLALVIAALWFGTSNAAREIVKERNVYLRERMVGLNVGAYVLSKILPLCALGALQAAILTVILGIHTNWFGDQSFGAVLTVWLLLTLAVASGTALGLVISAFARSPNQAISLTPVVLLPQLVFSGLFIALEEGSHLMKVLTNLAVSNWCFGALGKALDLNAMFGKSITLAPLGRAIFQRSLGTSVLVLVAMAALLTSIAWFALSFKRD